MAMSAEHKRALARGREEARSLRRYLEGLAARRPGRPVTADSLRAQLKGLDAKLAEEHDPLRRVELTQRRLDTKKRLDTLQTAEDRAALERDFVKHAKGYSERKGISYSAWRAEGVPAAVLKRAGIKRTRS